MFQKSNLLPSSMKEVDDQNYFDTCLMVAMIWSHCHQMNFHNVVYIHRFCYKRKLIYAIFGYKDWLHSKRDSLNINRWPGQKSNIIIQFFRIYVETPLWKIVFCALHGLNLKSKQSWSIFHNNIMMKQILLILIKNYDFSKFWSAHRSPTVI